MVRGRAPRLPPFALAFLSTETPRRQRPRVRTKLRYHQKKSPEFYTNLAGNLLQGMEASPKE